MLQPCLAYCDPILIGYNTTCQKVRSPTLINMGGCREANKEYDMICASQQLRLDKVPGTGHGVMGGKHVGFNKKQKHE